MTPEQKKSVKSAWDKVQSIKQKKKLMDAEMLKISRDIAENVTGLKVGQIVLAVPTWGSTKIERYIITELRLKSSCAVKVEGKLESEFAKLFAPVRVLKMETIEATPQF